MKRRKPNPDLIILPNPDLIVLPDIPDPPPLQLDRIDKADRKVPRIKSMLKRDVWTTRVVRTLAAVSTGTKGKKGKKGKEEKQHFTYWTPDYTIHISPDGDEYVYALAQEKADLLHIGVTRMGTPPRRLRRLETSHHHRKTKQNAALLRDGQKAAKAKLKEKKRKAKQKSKHR